MFQIRRYRELLRSTLSAQTIKRSQYDILVGWDALGQTKAGQQLKLSLI